MLYIKVQCTACFVVQLQLLLIAQCSVHAQASALSQQLMKRSHGHAAYTFANVYIILYICVNVCLCVCNPFTLK
jgi:hypothetical protein